MMGDTGEGATTQVGLNQGLVRELLFPETSYRPFGKGEPLSRYLYDQMEMTQSADFMIAFIDDTESYISPHDDETTQIVIERMAALIADMPDGVPEDERLRVWEHLFDSDWVHMHANKDQIERAIRSAGVVRPSFIESRLGIIEKELPGYIGRIGERLQLVLNRKYEALRVREDLPSGMPDLPSISHSSKDTLDWYTELRQHCPDALPLYNSIVVLKMMRVNDPKA